ncbi:hypothetical protein VTN02DRAFT_4185 [Thermoascus thermophilus]
MDRDYQSRGSATANSPLRHAVYYPDVSSPTRHASPRTRGSDASSSSRSRAGKGSANVPPRINTDISRMARNQPVITGQPATPPPREYRNSDFGSSSLVNPTSTLLQDLIKEQRATRGSRSRRTTMSDYAAGNGAASTPASTNSQDEAASEKQRKINEALSAGLKQPREMGIREMDQYVSKMNKLNFDLKLEIFHRVQQTAALEKKLERMREMEEELARMRELEEELEELRDVEENNQRLRESNEQLRLELDKRDQAVTEAVELICKLEARIEELEAGRTESQPGTARPHLRDGLAEIDSADLSTPRPRLAVHIPERTSSKRGTGSHGSLRSRSDASSSRRPRRTPSFLRDENKKTAALRSLYVTDDNNSHRTSSMLTKTESLQSITTTETNEPESPRLSILSECSYFDPYDSPVLPSQAAAQAAALTAEASEAYRSDLEEEESKLARIDQWIQPREEVFATTAQKPRDRAVSDMGNGAQVRRLGSAFQPKYAPKPHHHDTPRLDAPIFGGGRLPPTPDTMSTSHPGASRGSNGSIVAAEKGQYDRASLYLRRKLGHSRSAGEMTTRPSTAVSGTSGSVEMTTSDATLDGPSIPSDESPSLSPTYQYLGRGSSKATRLVGSGTSSNLRLSRYGGGIMFNGEGVKELMAGGKKDSTSSLKSVVSRQLAQSSSSSPPMTPLTPEDWLEAAKSGPRSKKERVDNKMQNELAGGEPTLDPQILPGSERIPSCASLSRSSKRSSAGELQLQRNPSLRQCLSANSPLPSPEPQSRRRFTLRPLFLGRRSSQKQQPVPASDPIDKDGAPFPVVPKTGGQSNPKHLRMSSVTEGVTGSAPSTALPTTPHHVNGAKRDTENSIIARQRSESNPLARVPFSRPGTSHSSSNSTEHKRRGSIGILGWMKGATQKGSGRSPPATPSSPITAFRKKEEKRFSLPLSRPSSNLAMAAAATTTMNDDTTTTNH